MQPPAIQERTFARPHLLNKRAFLPPIPEFDSGCDEGACIHKVPLLGRRAEQFHAPVLAEKLVVQVVVQPVYDIAKSMLIVAAEACVWHVVKQALDKVRRGILAANHSLLNEGGADILEHPNGWLVPAIRSLPGIL